jgi:hypothetical protein
MKYNATHGLVFSRDGNGDVTIEQDGSLVAKLSADTWISVVSAVSATDTQLCHQVIREIHTNGGISTCPAN